MQTRTSLLDTCVASQDRTKISQQLREWADAKVEKYSRQDVESMELLDMDQIDMDDVGPIKPKPERLASDLKQQWYATVEEEVKQQVCIKEEELKAQVQVDNSWFAFFR